MSQTFTTYSAQFRITSGVTGGNIVIQGSATKAVQILGILLSASALEYQLTRLSGITGGTSAVITGFPLDPLNPAATAVVRQYSVAPTLTVVGILDGVTFETNVSPYLFDYTLIPGQAIILRGTSDYLAIVSGATAICQGSIRWVET